VRMEDRLVRLDRDGSEPSPSSEVMRANGHASIIAHETRTGPPGVSPGGPASAYFFLIQAAGIGPILSLRLSGST
jgi:hypothetical protein